MTRPVDLTTAVAELFKRVESLEATVAETASWVDPNLLARLPREVRRARLGLSHLHEGKPDHRDIPVNEEVVVVDPEVKETKLNDGFGD